MSDFEPATCGQFQAVYLIVMAVVILIMLLCGFDAGSFLLFLGREK